MQALRLECDRSAVRGRLARFVVLGCCALASLGCVQRRFTIRTNPPGALVYVDNQEIGTTPVSHDFIYYGTREIKLVKDGYETQTVLTKMPTPWYELPGIDFISENLIPGEIRDQRVLDFQLQPQVIVPTEQLVGRAEELRRARNGQATGPTALPGIPPAGSAPPVMLAPSGGTISNPPPTALPPASLPPATSGLPAGPPAGPPLGPPPPGY